MSTYCNYIDGEWVPASNGQTFENRNPANTDDLIGHFPKSPREDAKRAIDAAHAAFPAWSAMTAPARGRIIAKAAQIMRERADELGAVMTREEGKTYKEARGELIKGANIMDFFVGMSFRMGGRTIPSEMPSTFTYTIRKPLGVVSLITPWNFPYAIPCWKIAPALISGNTVVFKPASLTPHSANEIVKAFVDAGLPKGVLNLVTGSGATIGDEMVANPLVQAVSFTGSTAVGMALNKQAAERGIKVTCEMGGKNAVIVMEDADLDLALEGVVQGAFGSTGQRCTATSRVIVHEAVADELVKRIAERASAITVGDGMKDDIQMGPAVDGKQENTNLSYIEIAKKEGATLVCGGEKLSGEGYDRGFFVQPTLFDNVTQDMRIFHEEVFGPVLSVCRVKSYEEAIVAANNSEYGLASSIYTRDPNTIMRYVDQIEVGMAHINQPTIGGEAQLPFGGIKNTGVGDREMSDEGFNFFTELKTVFFDYTGTRRDSFIY
jgi:alpha-ketoglutaric semialdehyde dehydrogenase